MTVVPTRKQDPLPGRPAPLYRRGPTCSSAFRGSPVSSVRVEVLRRRDGGRHAQSIDATGPICQIETVGGQAAVVRMAAPNGVDMRFAGPNDIAADLGDLALSGRRAGGADVRSAKNPN